MSAILAAGIARFLVMAVQPPSALRVPDAEACGSTAGSITGSDVGSGAGSVGAAPDFVVAGSGVGTSSLDPDDASASDGLLPNSEPPSACCSIGPRLITFGCVKP